MIWNGLAAAITSLGTLWLVLPGISQSNLRSLYGCCYGFGSLCTIQDSNLANVFASLAV